MQPKRKTLLLILTYLSVPILLVAVEIGLRIWSPGLDTPIVRPVSFDGKEWLELNRSFLRKYFPPRNPLVPELKPALLQKEKAPQTFRVICLGGSTMFGTPYQMTANIPGILRRQLRHAYPDRYIEVLNAGASAINSNVIVDLSKHLASLAPDLVVIYMGHNEYYGPDGVGAGFLERHIPRFIQFKYRLRDLRVVNLLLGFLKPAGSPADEPNLMREVSKGGKVHLHSDESSRIHDLFERNLADIISFWRDREVSVIVSDISSNLMFPPFVYDSVSSPLVKPAGVLLADFKEGRLQECEDGLQAWLRIDSTNAFAEYWLGRVMLERGDSGGGRSHLQRARDFDLLKFRAPSSMNGIIRKVCEKTNTSVVSADSLFVSLSSGGIPGDTLFWEHLHPTVRGYYEIARMLFDKIVDLRLVQADAPVAKRLPFNADSLNVCWLDLAYADLSIQHLTGRWPFTNYKREPAMLTTSSPEAVEIARAVYDRRFVWDKGCYESAGYFWKTGRTIDATTTYRALLEEYPQNYYVHYLLGNLLSKTGERDLALTHLKTSTESNPYYPNSRLDLGLLLINMGRFDEAIEQLATASSLVPAGKSSQKQASIYYGLGAAYANKGEYEKALQSLEKSLEHAPSYSDALALRDAIRREMK